MAEFFFRHWLLGIPALVIIGVICNGIWDMAAKPLVCKVQNALFSILTLGRETALNKIYREAARGHHDLPALMIFIFASIIISALITSKSIDSIIYIMTSTCDIGELTCSEREKTNINKPPSFAIILSTCAFFIFVSIVAILNALRINKINLVITYFDQCMRICGAYLSAKQLVELKSKFASMDKKEDFESILEELDVHSKDRNFLLPRRYC